MRSRRPTPIPNLEFQAGDVLDLSEYAGAFDLVVTERVLINLPSWAHQQQAIDEIALTLKPGGWYVMLENTIDGDQALNELRESSGWRRSRSTGTTSSWTGTHSPRMSGRNSRSSSAAGFSLYYVLTRVFAQLFASFEGFGANAKADPVFAMIDPAARRLEEALAGNVAFRDAAVPRPGDRPPAQVMAATPKYDRRT